MWRLFSGQKHFLLQELLLLSSGNSKLGIVFTLVDKIITSKVGFAMNFINPQIVMILRFFLIICQTFNSQPPCEKGRLFDCQFYDADAYVCLSKDKDRQYDWIEYEDGTVLGNKGQCENGRRDFEIQESLI